jgi:hypothetical protein
MRLSLVCAALASCALFSTAAMADPEAAPAAAAAAPLQVKAGQWIYYADGSALGRIDYVDHAKDGTPTTAGVISDMKVLHIPASTLSAGAKGYVTSMTKADVNKLK